MPQVPFLAFEPWQMRRNPKLKQPKHVQDSRAAATLPDIGYAFSSNTLGIPAAFLHNTVTCQ
jgi:hypothetical protein